MLECKEKIALAIKSVDNVATALNDIVKGDKILVSFSDKGETLTIEAVEDIPFGFKVALKNIQKGEFVIKYGEIIGKAVKDVGEGALVHIHNVEGLRGRGDLKGGGDNH